MMIREDGRSEARAKRCGSLAGVLLLATGVVASAGDLRLIEAAKAQNSAAVRHLVQAGVDVNASQPDGATALHWTVHWGDSDTADLLIRAGANVNAANDLGITPLHWACRIMSASMVSKLLKAGAKPNTLALTTGETPLMAATRTGSLEAVKALLAHGARPNLAETAHGQTALMWAVSRRHTEIVRTLLEHGADVRDRTKVHPLLFTRGSRGARQKDEVVPVEVPTGGFTPLLFAARQGDVESAMLLVDAGANANDVAADSMSALVIAAHSGNGAVATYLLQKGANPNSAGTGYTALHAAVLRGDLDLVKSLVAHGADPNAKLTRGTPVRHFSRDYALEGALVGATPYWLAAKFAEPAIMRTLAAGGADTTLGLSDGRTPLLAAAGLGSRGDRRDRTLDEVEQIDAREDERQSLEAVKAALDLGSDVGAADKNGETALHAVASKGFDSVVQLLVNAGAQLNVKNKQGLTPLGTAKNHAHTTELLRKLGAS